MVKPTHEFPVHVQETTESKMSNINVGERLFYLIENRVSQTEM